MQADFSLVHSALVPFYGVLLKAATAAVSVALGASAAAAARPDAPTLMGWRVIATGSSASTGVHVDSGLRWRTGPRGFALRLLSAPSGQVLSGGFGVDCRRGLATGSRYVDVGGRSPATRTIRMPLSNPGRCFASAYVRWGSRDGLGRITVQLLMR